MAVAMHCNVRGDVAMMMISVEMLTNRASHYYKTLRKHPCYVAFETVH